MSPRAKSASAVANDTKIRDAAINIAYDIGLQHLRFGHIVEKTGLSTGALYSRFTDHNDLLASLWVERLREPTLLILADAVSAFSSSDSNDIGKLASRLHKLTKTEWAGIEALVIARRIPELDELVSEDISNQLSSFGLHPNFTGSDVQGVRIVTILSLAIACAFNSFIDRGVDEWEFIFTTHKKVLDDLRPSPDEFIAPQGPLPVMAQTNDELRNALINATAEVIARSGLDGATLSRIARRSRMTSGAVYTLYSTKDELIKDALEVLITAARSDTSSLIQESRRVGSPLASLTDVYLLAFDPERRTFRRFRMEAMLSARTDKKIRDLIRSAYRQRVKEYNNMFGTSTSLIDQFAQRVARVGQLQPVGFSVLEHYLKFPERINLTPLSESIARNVRQSRSNVG
jgi:AcrR family transcriptional regulator